MRISNLKEKIARENLEGLILTDMKNIYYLTGFSGTAGTVFMTADNSYFMTDDRYIGIARQLITGFEIIQTRDALAEIAKLAEGLQAVGFEDTVDFAFYRMLAEKLKNAKLVPTANFVAELRQIKDSDEIATIKKACQIADKAFEAVLKYIEPGRTEIEVANFLDFKMREMGASGISFDTIVASGKRSSLPHGVATHKMIEFGDPVTIDFGCYYNHYASDMTRTVFVGEVDPKMREIYHTVHQANEALITEAKEGMSLADFDKVPRDVIEAASYGEYFTHGIGHGLGLDVHEIPYFGAKAKGTLKSNMVVTDEPGIYIPDFGGVRIEDDLLITEEGCQVLTQSPKELLIL